MFKFDSRALQICSLFLAAGVVPALAQGTGTPTCSTAPTSITNLLLERSVSLLPTSTTGTSTPTLPGFSSNATVFSAGTPTIPPNAIAAIGAGAVELREQVSLNTNNNVLNIQTFLAQPGTPSPTNLVNLNTSNVISITSIQVDKTYFSCQPVPSVLITGRVVNNFPNSPFGNLNGALVAVGIGYTTDNPPKLNNVTVMYPGLFGEFTAAGVGTLTFPAATVTPPTSAGNTPVIVFTPGQTQTVFSRQIQLDASQSKDPNGLQLTYAWTQLNPNLPASINNPSSATPTVTFQISGDYTFQVVVTNSQGAQSTGVTTISYRR